MAVNSAYDDNNSSKNLDLSEARQKIAKYCAYQERAHSEVEERLYSYGLHRDEVEDVLAWLITENFVNEERFAIAFAGGKFRVKRWGKFKIKQYLEQKKVSEYSINKALNEIDHGDYIKSIDYLIDLALRKVKSKNLFELRHKISRSVIAKGYDPELVWERLKLIVNDSSNYVE